MSSTFTLMKPPLVQKKVVEETLHGILIRDAFRYLEDAKSPDTWRFVEQQNAWTRSLLDQVPGRDRIHGRLEELVSIGLIGTPQIGGKY